ncbi:putative disease resistance RPP13-like protein 1 [Ziziphus jujuba]|uniref:Disease resistance RPP13-like protein 1 n=1 Tax=Ziziphus jujuba TaxID=326968 RepID=A0ABM3ZX76_ZIZJJ|nr:putative disease resistance RPP13-like protein 1 [Ziziphus jujuba]XP_060669084.1 putative disease resistance RPP13-like protein 1 [Ziziphus jujuba]XP_060669085.1 putative disease resistance RPP13-like protein 1 [Ziziphus jujuba]XP_060669086.1 putative disease resistance RPP13-like protein 1 [Ziziphus jujuba]XP_060669087.1 putative disease resistance RPP13-like protein 1 [Ziziphus jujuba]
MALELVAGAFLSASLELLFSKMDSWEVVDFIRGKKIRGKKIEEGLRKLKTMLLTANQVLNDAERKQITDGAVREWLQELKDAIYDAEDLVSEINNEALRSKLEANQSRRRKILLKVRKVRNFLPSRFDVKKVEERIANIISTLQFILEQKDGHRLIEGVETRPFRRISEATLVKESDIYGRDDDKEAIMKLLLSDHHVGGDKICVIPIVGMGGIGKTTLAQLVYTGIDNKIMEKPFDVKAWITVSEESDVFTLTKMIYQAVTESENCSITETFQLQKKLEQLLDGKKILLVLDDIWNVNYQTWCALKIPFDSAANGSKIIMTTRNENIASKIGNVPKHELQTISDEDSWQLFSKHAFSSVEPTAYPDLLEVIGRKIVKKCKGLPLAVKSLGGLLHLELDPKAWENILESDIWELPQQENNILPALWLSYYYLPPRLKRCFAYCSIFPKDYTIEKGKLIRLWMAEDLLQPQRNKPLEEVGNEYVKDLVSRSFFHVSSFDGLTMHDLLNDLAQFVSGESCLTLDDNYSWGIMTKKTRHLSLLMHQSYDIKKLRAGCENKVLRALLVLDAGSISKEQYDKSFPQLQSMQYLRVLSMPKNSFTHRNPLSTKVFDSMGGLTLLRYLHLSGSEIKKVPDIICSLYNLQTLILHFCLELSQLPDTIDNLMHLRYLDLSRSAIRRIPDRVCNLHDLRTLKLNGCRQLTLLPSNITMLSNLQHLDIDGTSLREMPPQLSNLKSLESLGQFAVGKNIESNIKELSKFQNLGGKLCITNLENVVNVEDVSEANLKDKKLIRELLLEWKGDSTQDSHEAWKVLETLQPHTANLEYLEIRNYKGRSFPGWIGHPSFSCLGSVELSNCKNCCWLPPLGQLPSLGSLSIRGFDMVERIGNEFFYDGFSSVDSKPFKSLCSLSFSNMPRWKEWSLMGCSKESCGGVFLNLEGLWFSDCPELNGACIPDYLPSLTHLSIIQSSDDLVGSLSRCECPSLDKLYLRCCHTMKSFPQGRLPSHIKSIQIDECSELVSLSEEGWPCHLNSLDISQCEKVSGGNLRRLVSLTSLKLQCLPNLKSLDGIGHLVSLGELYIYSCDQLQCLVEEDEGLPTSLTSIKLSNLPNLKSLNANAFRNLTSLQSLMITRCEKLLCLPEERLPQSLSVLDIRGSNLLIPRCQKETGEDWPKIAHVPRIIYTLEDLKDIR